MSNMTLQVEFLAGTSIEVAAVDAMMLARKLDLAYVTFNFNGVNVCIGKNADCYKVRDKLHKALQQEHKFFIENGRD